MMSPDISRINDQHLGQSEHVVNHIRYGNAILGNQIWITTVKLPQCRLQPRREKTLITQFISQQQASGLSHAIHQCLPCLYYTGAHAIQQIRDVTTSGRKFPQKNYASRKNSRFARNKHKQWSRSNFHIFRPTIGWCLQVWGIHFRSEFFLKNKAFKF